MERLMNDQFEVCWHGGMHREVPPPASVPVTPRAYLTRPAVVSDRAIAVVRALFKPGLSWSAREVELGSGYASARTCLALRALLDDGVLERQQVSWDGTGSGRRPYSYRLREQATQEAA